MSGWDIKEKLILGNFSKKRIPRLSLQQDSATKNDFRFSIPVFLWAVVFWLLRFLYIEEILHT